jgi:hypothetical protein
MWVPAQTFNDLLARLAKAEALAADLRQRAAVQQQNFDWLANHVNRLEIERATLMQRFMDVGVVAPQIQRDPTAYVGMGRPVAAEDRTNEDTGMALAAMMAGSFEDMGDEAAERLGVKHDPITGTVRYTQ